MKFIGRLLCHFGFHSAKGTEHYKWPHCRRCRLLKAAW